MALRIWAVAPQPFSDACGRSPWASFLSGLHEEMLAGLLILLGVHLGLLLLFLEVSNCGLPWQLCRRGLHADVQI